MPDKKIIMPGLSDKSTSQETIDKIMSQKRIKLDEMEKEKDEIKVKKTALNDIRQKTLTLQNDAKKLYDFNAPFEDKLSKSTDENAFTVSANRNAEIGDYSLEILNKAMSHKIASAPLDKKFNVPAGDYSIQVGSNKYKINFNGGSLEKFADEIKKDSNGKIRATVTLKSQNEQILVLESSETGKKNFITFADDKTKELFKKMNFFEEVSSYDKSFKFDKNQLTNLSSIKKEPQILQDNTLSLDRLEKYKFNLIEKVPYKEGLVMEVDLRVEDVLKEKNNKVIPGGPNYTKKGDLDMFGIHVEGESSLVRIPPFAKPEVPVVKEDNHFINIITNKREIKLDELDVTNSKKTLKFNLNNILSKDEAVEAVVFNNDNTYKRLEASALHFYDESSKAGIRFKNELSKPQDANIKMNGLEVQRETNTINDLIKGVTIYVIDKTKKEESVKVDRDYEKIVGTITKFIKEFNEFIDQITKQTDSRPNDEGKSGEFAGDYTLISLTSKLRTIMMNSYPTQYGSNLSLLAQIGISTNFGIGIGGYDKIEGSS